MELKEYKGMMDKVQIPENMDSRLKNRLLSEQKENKKMVYKKIVKRVAIAMVAVLVVFGASQTSVVSNVTAAIKEYFGKFHLSAGKEEIDFGEMVPVDIDYEAFKSAKGTKQVIGSNSYCHAYSDLEELEAETGLRLWSSDEIKVSYVSLHLDYDYHTGHIGCTFVYQGKKYDMNGMFMTVERKDNWGYGTELEPYRTYSYGDGQKAYFVKNKRYEGEEKEYSKRQAVYFAKDSILYQLFVENSQKGSEMAEKIIDEIAKK